MSRKITALLFGGLERTRPRGRKIVDVFRKFYLGVYLYIVLLN